MNIGIIYLIHFDEPLRRGRKGSDHDVVKHYLGWTYGRLDNGLDSYDLKKRFNRHKSGDGAKILKALNERGIGYNIVAAWDINNPPNRWVKHKIFLATKDDERLIKRQRNTPRYCPICRENKDGPN